MSALVYIDESGDDGISEGCSGLFVLTSVCMHPDSWIANTQKIVKFRQYLKCTYGLGADEEIHTCRLVFGKSPYDSFDLHSRQSIFNECLDCILGLDIKLINVAIGKLWLDKQHQCNILKRAVQYSIQRIENMQCSPYIVFIDRGRDSCMRKITNGMFKSNPIYDSITGRTTQHPIKGLLTPPIPVDSKDQKFVQLADFVAYLVSIYVSLNYLHKQQFSSKTHERFFLTTDYIKKAMNLLRQSGKLHTASSNMDEYGVVYYTNS